MLADWSKIKYPMTEVSIETRKTEAWCMENPIYDLIIGNIKNQTGEPEWTVNAVQTRHQVRKQSKPYSSLKVPGAIGDINPRDIIVEQQKYSTLRKLYSLAEEGKTITSRGEEAQWLSGRVLDSRPRGRGLKPHQCHCVVVLEQNTFILA